MGAQYFSFILQFAVTVIISRFFLTPSEVGLYSIAVAVTMMISILQDFGLTRYISGHSELSPERIDTCTSIAIVLGLAVVAVIFLSVWPIAAYYDDARLIPLLLILGASYLLTPFYMISTALLARDLNFRGLFFVNTLSTAASAITAITLAWAGFSASALAWSMVAQAVVKTIIAQRLSPVRLPPRGTLHEFRSVLNFGTGSAALTVIGAVGVRTPDLIIGNALGFAAVGLFSRATALAAQLYTLLSGAISSIFYPAFARIRDRGEALGPPYTRVIAVYCAVTMPAMVGLSAAAVPLVGGLFGSNWVGSAQVLQYVAISEILFIALPLHMDIPILMGRMKALILYNLGDSAASVILLIVGSHWGLEAAAASRIVYGIVWYALYARFMHSLIGFRWPDLLSIYLKSIIVSAAAVAPLLAGYRFWMTADQMNLVQLFLLCGCGVVTWLAAMLATKHPATREIQDMLATILAPVYKRFGLRPAS